jgi:hypothetical protein
MHRPTGKRVCPLGPFRIEDGSRPPTEGTVLPELNARHALCLEISALPTQCSHNAKSMNLSDDIQNAGGKNVRISHNVATNRQCIRKSPCAILPISL